MSINRYIVETFGQILSKSNFTDASSDSLSIKTENGALVSITPQEIILSNKIDLLSKIKTDTKKTNILASEKVQAFLEEIQPSFIRLNHVGISYFCKNPEEEIVVYKEALKATRLNIYQEQSESKYEKWYFIGNTTNYETPLCEIVLNSATNDWYKDWLPALQIDIDTKLSMKELERISEKYFGPNFWKWKLDIPDYGVVLAMAIVGEIDGVKLTFGVGTNLRNIKLHRESMQKLA
jgi:hypothetical protein